MINKWITDNHTELQKICKRVSKLEDPTDLCQICIEQFINNKKTLKVPDDEKLYFFTRIVQNNYYSKSSAYYYTYNKYKFNEFNNNTEIPDVDYIEDPINLEWVENELNSMDWYYKKLFKLFIEENCSISKLSQRTTIPLNSISRDINKVRKELIKRRNKYLK
jgi:DNA-directed RNA polymerase specialized sigma24 family protein